MSDARLITPGSAELGNRQSSKLRDVLKMEQAPRDYESFVGFILKGLGATPIFQRPVKLCAR